MILNVKNLHHSYGDIEALNNLKFSIDNNSIVSVLGPSGCGKTTLIRVIAGLEEIQKGEIFLDNNLVANTKFNTPPEKRPISYVFQDFALFPHMTVLENISFAAGSQHNKKQLINQLECPIGASIGKSKDPEEISFSILARMIEFKNSYKKDIKKLRRQVNEF